MIAGDYKIPKRALVRAVHIGAAICAIAVAIFFLRHSVVSSAESFHHDFERQTFIELSKGETFLVARKLAALSRSPIINCVTARKRGIVFFEETKGACSPGIFRSVQVVSEPSQEIEIEFTTRLPSELLGGFVLFLGAQLVLVLLAIFTQRQLLRLELQHELDMAAMARQVAHDIRSPLAIIAETSKDLGGITSQAIARLKDLINHLTGSLEESPEKGFSIGHLLEEAASEKQEEYGALVSISCSIEEGCFQFQPPGSAFSWRRLISNILNNSVEARRSSLARISISSKVTNSVVVIDIQDDGCGIPASEISRIGQRGYSFGKKGGTGLGLSAAREFLATVGGRFEIFSREEKGTQVILTCPISVIVLVDDDRQLGEVWKLAASRRGLLFHYFNSPEEFLLQASFIPRYANIYLDSDFPQRPGAGLSVGAKIKALGFRKIFLATGHPASNFAKSPWITAIVGKEPGFLL